MIHVVLDTNIYRKNPNLDNLYFKALERLAREERIKVHIPYIVEREIQTQQKEVCEIAINKSISGLTGLGILDKLLTPDQLKEIENLKKDLEIKKSEIISDSENLIIQWADSINANRVALCIDQSINSLEAYFRGTPPLKAPKIRKDIPDSFLVQSIEKTLKDNSPINFISNDKQLVEAFENHNDIYTFQELSDFIESDLIQKEIADLDLLQDQQEIINAIIVSENETKEIESTITNKIGEILVSKTIHDYSIPDDNNEATITGYYDPEDIEILIDEAFYYGENQFGIPFTLNINVSTIFYIFKSDLYSIEESEMPSISDHNKHYFEAEKEYEITVLGLVSITIEQENLDLDDLSENISDIEVSSIDKIKLLNSDYE